MVDTYEHMPEQITPADIGLALKAAREELGVSLVEISDKTRISLSYLEHIEAGRFDLLPSPAYVKGFLRNYCSFVHVDPAPLIEALEKADSSVSEKPEYRFPVQALVPKMASSMVALIIVCFALGGYLFWVTAIYDETDTGVVNQVALLPDAIPQSPLENQFNDIPVLIQLETGSAETQLTEQAAPAENTEIQPVLPAITDEDAAGDAVVTAADADGDEPQQILADTAQTQLASSASSPDAAAPAVAEDVSAATAPEVTAPVVADNTITQTASVNADNADSTSTLQTSEPALPDTPLATGGVGALATPRAPLREIVITATSAAWLEIARRDGEVLVSKLLRKGEKLVSAMDEELLLSTGNAGGLLVKTSEIEDFQLGKVGEILRDLPMSRDGMRTRYNLTSY